MDKTFIKSALIRAIRTVAQTAVATIGTAAVIADVNWSMVISASLLAGILSLLTSVATGLPEVEYAHSYYMDAEEPSDSYVDEPSDSYIEEATEREIEIGGESYEE